jgi:rhodanese-related sulfurtransferase
MIESRPTILSVDTAHAWSRARPVLFVDARPTTDYAQDFETIPGSIHVPVGDPLALDEALVALPAGRWLIVYCRQDDHAASVRVARRALALGRIGVFVLGGGLTAWKLRGYPVEIMPAEPNVELGPTS